MEAGGPNSELDEKLATVAALVNAWSPVAPVDDLLAAIAQARVIIANVVVPGWFCDACRTFNGDGRFHLTECRSCGGPR